jgi:molybdate transport system ATP-binding protein
VPPHQRALGVVFQEASLFPHLSVRGNMEFGEKSGGRP